MSMEGGQHYVSTDIMICSTYLTDIDHVNESHLLDKEDGGRSSRIYMHLDVYGSMYLVAAWDRQRRALA